MQFRQERSSCLRNQEKGRKTEYVDPSGPALSKAGQGRQGRQESGLGTDPFIFKRHISAASYRPYRYPKWLLAEWPWPHQILGQELLDARSCYTLLQRSKSCNGAELPERSEASSSSTWRATGARVLSASASTCAKHSSQTRGALNGNVLSVAQTVSGSRSP